MPAVSAKASAVFRGDDEGLLDQLVAACHEHKGPKPLLPGFGRELTPFTDFEGENPVASKPAQPAQPAQRGTKHGKMSPSTLSPQRKGARTNKASSPAAAQPQSAAPSAARFSDNAAAGPKPVMPPPSAPRAVPQPKKKTAGPAACPGFFSSPKPEALPTPSSLLLARAAATAARSMASMAQPVAIAAA